MMRVSNSFFLHQVKAIESTEQVAGREISRFNLGSQPRRQTEEVQGDDARSIQPRSAIYSLHVKSNWNRKVSSKEVCMTRLKRRIEKRRGGGVVTLCSPTSSNRRSQTALATFRIERSLSETPALCPSLNLASQACYLPLTWRSLIISLSLTLRSVGSSVEEQQL